MAERELALALTVKPVDQQIDTVTKLAGVLDGLKGDNLTDARARIASALPTIFPRNILFYADGSFVARRANFDIPPFPAVFDRDDIDERKQPDEDERAEG